MIVKFQLTVCPKSRTFLESRKQSSSKTGLEKPASLVTRSQHMSAGDLGGERGEKGPLGERGVGSPEGVFFLYPFLILLYRLTKRMV